MSSAIRFIQSGLVAVCLSLPMTGCTIISSQLSGNNEDDIQAARAVKSSLMASDSINAAPLRIVKRNNLITLSGFVEFEEEKAEAERIVRNLYPTASINNDIKVR